MPLGMTPKHALQILKEWGDQVIPMTYNSRQFVVARGEASDVVGAHRALRKHLEEITTTLEAGVDKGIPSDQLTALRAEADELQKILRPMKVRTSVAESPTFIGTEASPFGIGQMISDPLAPREIAKQLPSLPRETLAQTRAEQIEFDALRATTPEIAKRNRGGFATEEGGGPDLPTVRGLWERILRGRRGTPGADIATFADDYRGEVDVAGSVGPYWTKRWARAEATRIAGSKEAATDLMRRVMLFNDNPAAFKGTLSPLEQTFADEAGRLFEEGGQIAKAENLIDELVDNYVHRRWKGSEEALKNFSASVVQKFNTAQGPQKVRTLLDIAEGKARGLELRFDTIDESLGAWIESMGKAAADRRFYENLSKVYDLETGLPILANHNMVRKAGQSGMYVDTGIKGLAKFRVIGKLADETTLGAVTPLLAHREIAPLLKAIIDEPSSNAGLRALLTVNAFAKTSILGFSAFHFFALTSSMVATSGGRAVRYFRARGNLGQDLFASGSRDIEDLIRAGLELGPLSLKDAVAIQKVLDDLAAKVSSVPLIGGLAGGIAKVNKLWNYALWDWYFRTGKIATAMELRYALLKQLPRGTKMTDEVMHSINKVAAERTNAAMGGLNWNRLLLNRKWQNAMRIALLAPDWTASNLLVAVPVITNTGIRGKLARQYALRAGVATAAVSSLANLAFSGHFPWENPAGFKDKIQLPWKDDKGRAKFIDLGKQFSEPLHWASAPIDTANRKMGILPRWGFSMLTNRNYFGQKIVAQEDDAIMNTAKRLGYTAESVLPIPAQQAVGVARGRKIPSDVILGALGLPTTTEFVRGRKQP